MRPFTRILERLMNLRRGDLARGGLLFSYLFLIMASYLVARVARDALFLHDFKAEELPFVDIAIAALMGVVISGYILVARKTSLRGLLLGSLFVYGATYFIFWWLAHYHDLPWLFPVLYVWVGIFGALAPAQVWTLANYVLTTREAKRVFGLVGGGAISGAILGGKYASVMAPRFGTESLLLSIALAQVLAGVLVVFIWRRRERALAAAEDTEPAAQAVQAPNLRESLSLIWSSPYLKSIATLILVANIVTSLAGWQFKAIGKAFIPDTDLLAAFFGNFYFYAGIAGLLVQLTLTARFLRRFGLGPALFVVPVALMLGSVSVLAAGALWAGVMLRAGINVFQYSIDKSAIELLYLPVRPNIKIQVKSFIDTVIWRLGDGLQGFLVLLFARTLGLTWRQVSWVTMALILAWCAAAWSARRQYVRTLRESIRGYRLDSERSTAPVLDRSTADIFAAQLCATDPKEILYALSLFEAEQQTAAHPAIRELLAHPSAEVRCRAIAILSAAGDRTVLPRIEQLLHDPALEVRTEALLYLAYHAHVDPLARIEELGDFPDFSIRSAMVAFLARPGEAQNLEAARALLDTMVRETGPEGRRTRREAARLIGALPPEFDEQLRLLLSDEDKEIAGEALEAVGRLRRRRFVGRLLLALGDAELAAAAAEGLARFGDYIVGTLRDHLTDPGVSLEIRRQIPGVLVRIGTPAAARVLANNLLEADTALRFRIISALNKLHQRLPEITFDRQMVETVLAAEILGHYRSYQILGTLGGKLDAADPVSKALGQSMAEDIERIFRLLSLLFPHFDFHSAYVGLQSDNVVVHDNALEFLDNILRPQLRDVLVPLLDKEVSVAERVRRANRMIGAKIETREEAVAALLSSDDPWLKSCGAYAVGSLGLRQLERQLDACLDHPDPLLRETARAAKLRLGQMAAAGVPAAIPASD